MSRWDALLEELVGTRRSALIGFAYALAGDLAEAEDLVHEALLRTFAKPRSLKDVEHAEAYVRRAIATTFLNGRRKHRRFLARVHLLAASPTVDSGADAMSDADAVRAALATLAPRERACVVLRYYEQARVREIAEALGLAEGSVKRYLADGMRKLEAQLGPLAADAPDGAQPAAEPIRVVSARGHTVGREAER